MQTSLTREFAATAKGQEAEAILRKCVHCGFCNATCPTYQLLGDELDGPRGRIYLIKQVLEGAEPDPETQLHLDRCLTCRNCETTCPSGVEYSKLAEIGRDIVGQAVTRRTSDSLQRKAIAGMVRNASVFRQLLNVGSFFKWLLPENLSGKIYRENKTRELTWPAPRHERKMVVLGGCAQKAMTPGVNVAAALVLDRLGISLVEAPGAGCCGSLDLHTTSEEKGREVARRLIDTWYPLLEQGVEAFVSSASGCGAALKDYGHLFRHDEKYREKAERIARLSKDLCEILENEDPKDYEAKGQGIKVAFHPPCTLQHGQKITGKVEKILIAAGYQLLPVPDAHLCCGSAGSYALLQPEISLSLKKNKQENLLSGDPDLVCTANIGCQAHLAAGLGKPVVHWIELLV